MEKIYIFDFDGVICDSNLETFDNSLNTFLEFINFKKTIKKNENLLNLYVNNRHMVRRPSDFLNFWFFILKKKIAIDLRKCTSLESKKYEKLFFENREKSKKTNKEEWLKKNFIYKKIKPLIKALILKDNIFIASTKDVSSIKEILDYNKIFFNMNKIYGSESYNDKDDMFKEIKKLHKNSEIIFIDDNKLNLDKALKFKFKCYYATWGYGVEKKIKDIDNINLDNLNQIFV
jgi:phosphoglycolate phosphatase-like HAD superfamily hydrolase